MLSRRRPRRPRRPSIWLRIVAAFVLAMVTSWATLAWAIPCCGHDDPCGDEAPAAQGAQAQVGDEVTSDHPGSAPAEEPCSCPPGCGPCCGTMPPPALLPLGVPLLSHLASWIDLVPPDRAQSPPDGAEKEVLHVPKGRLVTMA